MPHRTQHRASREGRRAHELADLRRNQHRLEVERTRLLEALERAPRPRKERPPKEPAPPVAPKHPCPRCGMETKEIDLGRVVVVACPGCRWHEPQKS